MHRELTIEEIDHLNECGWNDYRNNIFIWIRALEQRLYVINQSYIIRSYSCSTSESGLGNERNTHCTPKGWHEIVQKIGQGLPEGAILESRNWTGKVWTPSSGIEKDLILNRILWLSGLEKGYNSGESVDSFKRYIYIHGTNRENDLGSASSQGCIRLNNEDIIDLFDLTSVGNKVFIE